MAEDPTDINDIGDEKIDLDTYDEAVAACRPVNPADYPPALQAVWTFVVADMNSRGIYDLSIYPGSTPAPCAGCGIQIGIGPRQQQTIARTKNKVLTLCLVCAGLHAAGQVNAGASIDLGHLGNTDR